MPIPDPPQPQPATHAAATVPGAAGRPAGGAGTTGNAGAGGAATTGGGGAWMKPREQLEPIAAILAVAFPGAGHLYLGETRRGLLIMAGVLGLFLGGILIGGIDVVDRREDSVWFIGQALNGPIAFGADYIHQNFFKGVPEMQKAAFALGDRRSLRSAGPDEYRALEDESVRDSTGVTRIVKVPVLRPIPPGGTQRPPNSKSLGRMNELGTLFGTIAGMLNLIVIIDAAYHARREDDPALAHAARLLSGGGTSGGRAR